MRTNQPLPLALDVRWIDLVVKNEMALEMAFISVQEDKTQERTSI